MAKEGRASMDGDTVGSRREGAALQSEDVYLYEGGVVEEERKRDITRLRIGPQVKDIPRSAFEGCINLAEVRFDEGALQYFGEWAFHGCEALQQVAMPSSVTKLGLGAFGGCTNLSEVHFNDGLQVIGGYAFRGCKALQHVTIPSSVTELGDRAFAGCSNLVEAQFKDAALRCIEDYTFHYCTALQSVTLPSSVKKLGRCSFANCTSLTEVILGGKMLLNRGLLDRSLPSGKGVLNRQRIKKLIRVHTFLCCILPAIKIKISIPPALSLRMARLPRECRLSIEGRIHDMCRLEMAPDGTILACFPLIWAPSERAYVEDTDNQTAASLHQVLRLISFHELKESSILIELAVWKSRFGEDRAHADCRIAVPDPAKILIMEYCGFTGFLEPAIEGA